MSFGETIFLFLLALVIFGPKKLPEIARQAGRLLNEVKRASNEFKAQIEQEVNNLEREDARKALPPATPPEGVVVSRLNGASAASDSLTSETILSDQPSSDQQPASSPESATLANVPAPSPASVPAPASPESHG